MHASVFYIAIVWLALLLAVNVVQAVRHRDVLTRVLAVDTSSLVLIAILLVLALYEEASAYLDPALMLGLLSFVETLVAARFLAGGGLFSR